VKKKEKRGKFGEKNEKMQKKKERGMHCELLL